MIPMQCPTCRERFDVPDSRADQNETCPGCHQAVHVPKQRAGTPRGTRGDGAGVARVLDVLSMLLAALSAFAALGTLIDAENVLLAGAVLVAGITSAAILAALSAVLALLRRAVAALEAGR